MRDNGARFHVSGISETWEFVGEVGESTLRPPILIDRYMAKRSFTA